MARRTITVYLLGLGCRPEPHQVMAEIVGPFGVHRGVSYGGTPMQEWVVTHIRTGQLAASPAVELWPTRAKALTVARELAALPVSWDFNGRQGMPKITRRRGLALIKRHARGV